MNKARGFTLLEVVIALAVVSIAVVSLVQAVGSNVRNAAHLQDKMLAQWLGENQLNNIFLKSAPPSEGDDEGKVEFAGRKWRWQSHVKKSGMPELLRVEVKIFSENSENSLVSLQSYIGAAMQSCTIARGCMPSNYPRTSQQEITH